MSNKIDDLISSHPSGNMKLTNVLAFNNKKIVNTTSAEAAAEINKKTNNNELICNDNSTDSDIEGFSNYKKSNIYSKKINIIVCLLIILLIIGLICVIVNKNK